MILTFFVLFLVLLAVLYVFALFIEWRGSHEQVKEIEIEHIAEKTKLLERHMRRAIYSVRRVLRDGSEYGGEKIRELFLRLFPSAENALKEHDLLTGLKSGPSSYFLLELSQFRPKSNRRKQKNMQE